jgi:hypothetical protein
LPRADSAMDVWGQAISNGGGGNCNIALNIIR